MSQTTQPQQIKLRRLLGAALYESLILIALWMLATALFMALFGQPTHVLQMWGLRAFLWGATGAYFCWCWVKSGQTLATKTWRMRLKQHHGRPISVKTAVLRYALVSASLLAVGLGFVWILWDKDRLFLHDRLAKTYFEAA